MTLRLLVVCEAPADFRIASDLADRVLRERVAWLDETILPSVRNWWELDPEHSFMRWDALEKIAKGLGFERLRPRSRFNGEIGAPDAAAADLALQLAALIARSADLAGVLLIRDTDKYEARWRGLDQARTLDHGRSWPFKIVLGVAHPKREAWVLAGFEAQDGAEHQRLGEISKEIGRDPCVNSHELTARTKGSKRDIKRVLDHLTAADSARELPCWQQAPLERLRERGQNNGLAAYLAEIDEHIVPLLSPQ